MNKDFTKLYDKILAEQSGSGNSVFITFSDADVCQLVNDPFGEKSPIQMKKMESGDYQKLLLLNSIKDLADMIEKAGSLKLTKTGCLQRKVVIELYERNFRAGGDGLNPLQYKVPNEADFPAVTLTRFLLELSGLTKKRNGKLSLTQKWSKFRDCDDKLLQLIFEAFTRKLNWSYFDNYFSEQAGQIGFGVSLALISKYGSERSSSEMYAKLYYKIFPECVREFSDSSYSSREENAYRCYSLRTFARFLEYFNLVKVFRDKKNYLNSDEIVKTDLFDKFISCSL